MKTSATLTITALTLGLVLVAVAPSRSAAQAPCTRLEGLQVWNCDTLKDVCSGDHYGPNLKNLVPIQIVGVRNGVFSGRIIVTNANQSIRDLKAEATDLVQTGDGATGKIAASCVRMRYAVLATAEKSWMPRQRFDGLLDQPPAEVPTIALPPDRAWKPVHEAAPVATVPIWVTVSIPTTAPAGDYEGKVSVRAEGDGPIDVVLRVKVHDWALPDPIDFNVHNLAYLAQACHASHYDVPLWSERHMELMGQSMKLMRDVGSRSVMIHLTTGYYAQDSRESMVKWLKQADGSFQYDFTAVDKYLETIAKSIGKPYPLRINMFAQMDRKAPQKNAYLPVTVVDSTTGEVKSAPQPAYGTPESEAFWKPVLAELRTRLEKRGWLDVTVFGDTQYCGAMEPENVTTLLRLWPGARGWTTQHGGADQFIGMDKAKDRMPVLFGETIWGEAGLSKTRYRGLLNRPAVWARSAFHRNQHGESYRPQLLTYRLLCEHMQLRGYEGIGQLGTDLWPIKDPRNGRIYKLGGGHIVGPDSSTRCILYPGPDGPVATERYEAFRDSVNVSEAILYLQNMLDRKKLDGAMTVKVATLLKDRIDRLHDAFNKTKASWDKGYMGVFPGFLNGADERNAALFALAAEVAVATKVTTASSRPD